MKHHELNLKKSITALKGSGRESAKPSQNEEEYFKRLDAEKIRDIKDKKKHDKEIIADFNRQHDRDDDLLFIKKLRNCGVSEADIALVIRAMMSTCQHCFDSEKPCHCMNDE